MRASESCLDEFTNLEEAFVMTTSMYSTDEALAAHLTDRGVTVHDHTEEGFWSESVAEFGIGLTIDALRRIPQKYEAMNGRTTRGTSICCPTKYPARVATS
ncbi:hypothetical protein ACFFQF_28335 [Haladaptatus pallidirubidus]|uniref:Uncharacterized protein n=1 Tax=Haladaptatus pallidirubidus TaxID=1008152 RepID=A0AAV3UJF5_9EURY|nr:hypothetical protein [Haladaptatus pallidirubidus]